MIVLAWISIVIGIILFLIGIITLLTALGESNFRTFFGLFWSIVFMALGALLALVPGAFLLGRYFGP